MHILPKLSMGPGFSIGGRQNGGQKHSHLWPACTQNGSFRRKRVIGAAPTPFLTLQGSHNVLTLPFYDDRAPIVVAFFPPPSTFLRRLTPIPLPKSPRVGAG